jgi:hypothetical protein
LGSFDEIKKLSKTELKTARRMLLADELQWLCKEAEIVFLLPGWERSPGATAERAVALALGLDVRETPEVLIPADWEPELDIPAEP